jgi:NADP-dependent 3-hydroxy acid dehydrogenase YdfG
MRNGFITGVSAGLGRALAEAALAKDEPVIGTAGKAEAATSFEALAPGRAHAVLLDVHDAERVRGVGIRTREAVEEANLAEDDGEPSTGEAA